MKINIGKLTIETTTARITKDIFKYNGKVAVSDAAAYVAHIFGYGVVLFLNRQ